MRTDKPSKSLILQDILIETAQASNGRNRATIKYAFSRSFRFPSFNIPRQKIAGEQRKKEGIKNCGRRNMQNQHRHIQQTRIENDFADFNQPLCIK